MTALWSREGIKRYVITIDNRKYVIEAHRSRGITKIHTTEILKMGGDEARRRGFISPFKTQLDQRYDFKWTILVDGKLISPFDSEHSTLKEAKLEVNVDCDYWNRHGMSKVDYIDRSNERRQAAQKTVRDASKALSANLETIEEDKILLANHILYEFSDYDRYNLYVAKVLDLIRALENQIEETGRLQANLIAARAAKGHLQADFVAQANLLATRATKAAEEQAMPASHSRS